MSDCQWVKRVEKAGPDTSGRFSLVWTGLEAIGVFYVRDTISAG